MITDDQTNFLYLADSLPKKYPSFYNEFEKVLTDCNIPFQLLTPTKDVWAVDYMPVQIGKTGLCNLFTIPIIYVILNGEKPFLM